MFSVVGNILRDQKERLVAWVSPWSCTAVLEVIRVGKQTASDFHSSPHFLIDELHRLNRMPMDQFFLVTRGEKQCRVYANTLDGIHQGQKFLEAHGVVTTLVHVTCLRNGGAS